MGSSSPRCGPRVVCAPRVVVLPRDVARGRCRERLRAPRGSGDFGGPPRCARGVVVRVSDRGSAPDVSRSIVGGGRGDRGGRRRHPRGRGARAPGRRRVRGGPRRDGPHGQAPLPGLPGRHGRGNPAPPRTRIPGSARQRQTHRVAGRRHLRRVHHGIASVVRVPVRAQDAHGGRTHRGGGEVDAVRQEVRGDVRGGRHERSGDDAAAGDVGG
mmetsp:Transcript_597/g.2447  ORF Transcript_597/g.2447 Transcript_597/m.2447 type:complete len:213 (-) Transcript_597:181-819(-)